MENSNKLKADFVRMCGLLEITANGLQFPDDIAELDDDFQDVFESSDYPMLREKMDNLINLINSDTSLINKDIEDELWYMI
jgi:hypothetical protein